MQLVFLNTRSFVSKKGKDCHMVTFASLEGVVMDFFHDGDLDVGNIRSEEHTSELQSPS